MGKGKGKPGDEGSTLKAKVIIVLCVVVLWVPPCPPAGIALFRRFDNKPPNPGPRRAHTKKEEEVARERFGGPYPLPPPLNVTECLPSP